MMRKYATGLGVGLVLLVGVGLVALRAAEDKPVQADTKKLADEVGTKDWDALAKAGAPLAKKYQLDDIMHQFKPRGAKKNAGIGVGNTPGAIKPDGIELKLNNMTKRVTITDVKNAKDLQRMAEISAAIAGIIVNQQPPGMGAGKNPAAWKKHSKDMYARSKDLIKALNGKDTAAIKKAAINLNSTCTECHSKFRDD